MERFIIGVALAAAGLFALGAATGGSLPMNMSFSFVSDGRGVSAATGTGGQAVTAASETFAARRFRFEDGFARLVVIPEERADIAVRLVQAGAVAAPVLRVAGDRLIIDGELGASLRGCSEAGATLADGAVTPLAQAPVIEVRTPKAVRADVVSAGYVEIGPAASADLEVVGCGRVSLGPVAGDLELRRAGSGLVRVDSAAKAEVEGLGDGRIEIGAISEQAELSVAGSNRIVVREARGDADVSVRGNGEVEIVGGDLTTASAEVTGSGSIKIAASIAELEATVTGSGAVTVAAPVAKGDTRVTGSGVIALGPVTGALERRIVGSGQITAATTPAAPAPPTPPTAPPVPPPPAPAAK
jgi:hypothetical protein